MAWFAKPFQIWEAHRSRLRSPSRRMWKNDAKFDVNFDEFTKIRRRKHVRPFSEVMETLHEAMTYKFIISKNKFAAFIEGIVEDDLDDPEFVSDAEQIKGRELNRKTYGKQCGMPVKKSLDTICKV